MKSNVFPGEGWLFSISVSRLGIFYEINRREILATIKLQIVILLNWSNNTWSRGFVDVAHGLGKPRTSMSPLCSPDLFYFMCYGYNLFCDFLMLLSIYPMTFWCSSGCGSLKCYWCLTLHMLLMHLYELLVYFKFMSWC